MRATQITFFMLAILSLSAQIIHYSYKRFNLPGTSLLNKKIDNEIVKIKSLDELHKKYQTPKKAIQDFEKTKSPAELKRLNKYQNPIYKTKHALHTAIQTWESNSKKHTKMLFYWFAGLLFFIIGAAIYYYKKLWLGLGFIVAGVSEMIWWSSPSFSYTGSTSRLASLLTTQMALTIVSLIIVITAWTYKKGLSNPSD